MSNPDHPLTGIRVLDLTQIYNGPYATFLMAMAGADVIKVEPPGGEHLRRRNARGGALYPFKMLNPNKRSILLDLKNEDRLSFSRVSLNNSCSFLMFEYWLTRRKASLIESLVNFSARRSGKFSDFRLPNNFNILFNALLISSSINNHIVVQSLIFQ